MHVADSFWNEVIETATSSQSISRGQAYAAERRVTITSLSDTEIQAEVQGTVRYRVRLWKEGGDHRWRCDCPVGLTGEFCKHGVAALVTAADPTAATDTPATRSEHDELTEFISSLPAERLTALVLEQAQIDQKFRIRLSRMAQLANAAAAAGTGASESALDLRQLKKEVTAAFGRGFISYREAGDWADGVLEAIEWISDVNDAGHFRVAALLIQHAHKRAESAMNRVDDSGGEITEICHRLAELHVAACAEGAFPPEDLARRLIKLELDAELDTFHRSAMSHRDALGAEGLAIYGRLAQNAYDGLAPDGDPWGRAFRVRQACIAHAIATQDPDRLVEVLGGEIRSPFDHVEIIDTFQNAGRLDEALAWADTSLEVFADRHHQLTSVRERRANLLRELGDEEAIVEMYRESFEATPTPETYRLLVEASPNPDQGRAHAIEYIIKRLPTPPDMNADEPETRIGRPVTNPAAAGVVAVLLAADDHNQAWHVATEYGATETDWRRLAEHRQLSDPESAIAVLAIETERAIDKKNRSGYRAAVQLLERIGQLADKANQPELHQQLIEDIISRHHRKSSFMQLLQKSGAKTN